MSLVISLIPLAIAVSASLGTTTIASVASTKLTSKNNELFKNESMETIFNSKDILLKTLNEHGLNVTSLSDNEHIVQTEEGTLKYHRNSENSPFLLDIVGVHDMNALLNSVDELENQYGKNVQAFTYDKVMCSLEEYGMSVQDEEVFDDDSILLTINI